MSRVVSVFPPQVVLFLAFLVPGSLPAGELSAVLTPVADTGLYEIIPTNNLGGSLAVPAGVHTGGKRSRYLVRFDPTGTVPAGAQVTSVELRLRVTAAGTASHDYGIHRMERAWTEGRQPGNNGSGAAAGETTWLSQFHLAADWTLPGGLEGVDYALVPSVVAPLRGVGSTNVLSGAGLVVDVQHWLDEPHANFGWILRAVDETVSNTARRVASRETPEGGPVLIVHYLPPDSDFDGIGDAEDQCPGTASGAPVNAVGCSLDQLVPCEAAWANHGHFMATLAARTEDFVNAGLLTPRQRAEILQEAARSPCGR